MLKNIKGSLKALVARRLNKKNEIVTEGVLNGKDDVIHEMYNIATILGIAALIFGIFYLAAPELANTIITWVKGIFTSNLK
ncbi:hypothetical protein [Erysipelothrix anatis]|uniref:hypothetical protein n=1 Tax=Erysipelothrix anatis TaxID=2683713 RepID=UPI00140C51FB|nr:hypothetical protein [Erysipelothrix anatis]